MVIRQFESICDSIRRITNKVSAITIKRSIEHKGLLYDVHVLF